MSVAIYNSDSNETRVGLYVRVCKLGINDNARENKNID